MVEAPRPESNPVALHALVYGRVQGVNCRIFVEKWARQLGLKGFVRNLPDRSVEVYAEGERKQLEQLLEALRQGPPGARVDGIDAKWPEPTGKYVAFRVTG